ncbi:MAG: AmmeMemoRadiSam system protein B [Nitrospiraceae bacterium]|nr:AmmeMemoRadiSam system protein B [Nitrospiraceae bacterium]
MTYRHIALLTTVLVLAAGAAGAAGAAKFVRPIAAGLWYPEQPQELRDTVDGLLKAAQTSQPSGRCVASIVPHAPYATSGQIAAEALSIVRAEDYDRVIVLAGSHHTAFRGCSIPSAYAYRTPLGNVVIDGPAVRALDRSTLIEVRSLRYGPAAERKQLHERESNIEVVLPFLQVQLGTFQIVPVVVGDFKDHGGQFDEAAMEAVAKQLRPLVDERTLIVVSSNFTHFGNRFSYRPFRENIVEGIEALDRAAFDCILRRDYAGYLRYLKDTRNRIDGKYAIALMLKLLPEGARGKLLAHEISARKTGDTRTSISYAALAFAVPADGVKKKPVPTRVLRLKGNSP